MLVDNIKITSYVVNSVGSHYNEWIDTFTNECI